jgi:hypothetical protein
MLSQKISAPGLLDRRVHFDDSEATIVWQAQVGQMKDAT